MTDPVSSNDTAATIGPAQRDRPTHDGPAGWRIGVARRVGVLSVPFEWLVRFVRIIESAIPIGLLRRSDIGRIVHMAYAEAPDFYDPDKYRIRYEEQLLPLIERSVGAANGRRLLDLYCGHGREAEIFSRTGFDVFAVDAQPAVIERARQYAREAGFAAQFTIADIDSWSPADRNWDVIYTSLWMYSTIPDRDSRVDWLRRLSGWLAPGGCMIISITPWSSGYAAALRHAVAWIVRILTLNPRRPELGDRFHTGLFWHDFTSSALHAELAAAGMQVVDSLEIGGGTPCDLHLLQVAGEED
ncbi:MAG: class I SAM-dependent methyltransferase [Gammaproteobacteria bacterium]